MGIVICIDDARLTTVNIKNCGVGDLSHAWFTSAYPFEEMTCGHDLLGHADLCINPAHHPVFEAVERMEMGFQDAAAIDRELRGAKLLLDDPDTARNFTALNSWLGTHYQEIIRLRERFAGFYR